MGISPVLLIHVAFNNPIPILPFSLIPSHTDPYSSHAVTLTKSLNGVSVLCHHAERSLEMMVHLVNILVDGAMMKQLVYPVVPGVL